MGLIFEWDDKKARENVDKHKISFEEASTVFGDPLSLTIIDLQHSYEEERFIIIGESINQQLLVVVHIERGDTIRIISARTATSLERKTYEEN